MRATGRWVPVRVLVLAILATPAAASAQQTASPQPDTAHLGLADAVAMALAQHPTVERARAERDRSGAVAGEARSAVWPHLAVEANAVRFEEPMVVSPIHGFSPGVLPMFDRTLIQGNAGASWLLFDGGARRARIARAESSVEAADAAVAAVDASLTAAVTRAYLGVGSARETLAAHDATLVALASERERAQRLFDEGRAARLAVLRAEAASSRARAD
ncbi:MAG: TolC family protein, partial [Longimicrobiales bacterium]